MNLSIFQMVIKNSSPKCKIQSRHKVQCQTKVKCRLLKGRCLRSVEIMLSLQNQPSPITELSNVGTWTVSKRISTLTQQLCGPEESSNNFFGGWVRLYLETFTKFVLFQRCLDPYFFGITIEFLVCLLVWFENSWIKDFQMLMIL